MFGCAKPHEEFPPSPFLCLPPCLPLSHSPSLSLLFVSKRRKNGRLPLSGRSRGMDIGWLQGRLD